MVGGSSVTFSSKSEFRSGEPEGDVAVPSLMAVEALCRTDSAFVDDARVGLWKSVMMSKVLC